MPVAHLQRQRRLHDLARFAAAHLGRAAPPAPCVPAAPCAARRGRPGCSCSTSSARSSGSDPSGSRKPSGESPGSAYRCSRFNGHGLDSQTMSDASSTTAFSGSTNPAGRAQARREQPRETGALVGLRQVGRQRIGICGQRRLVLQQFRNVLVGGDEQRRRQPERGGDMRRRMPARKRTSPFRACRVGDQRVALPQRHAIAAPEHTQRPARQRLARVPLALAVVEKAFRRESGLQALQQDFAQLALLGRQRRVVPFRTVHVVDRHERRLAALA